MRTAGITGLVAGVLGAAAGIWLAVIPPRVGAEYYSHPLDASAFVGVQVAFAVHHVGLVIAVLGLRATSAVSTATGVRALMASALCLAALAALEVVACLGASSLADSATAASLNTAYGVVTLAIGTSMTVLGVCVVRAGVWRGWRAWTPLIVGLYLFVPLTPLMALGGDVARFGIAGWMLTFVLLGAALLTAPLTSESPGSARVARRGASRASAV